MASVSGVSNSNTISSLMNSANMISGLASGLDTEGMIEQLVKSYQTKISQLNQKVTKVEWKQDAYRSIISKMVGFSNKYTSYASSTNLLSASLFSNAVKVSTLGKYADAVSASGKTSSSVSLNAVHQLASAAQYRTAGNMSAGDGNSIEASKGIDLNGTTTLGSLDGNLTLTYGSQTVSLSFNEVADVKAMDEIRAKLGEGASDADVLAELINQKLSGQTISLSGGKTADATDRIQVTAQNGRISFSDKSDAGNAIYISAASNDLAETLGIGEAMDEGIKLNSFSLPDSLTYDVKTSAYVSGKTMNVSLDGVVKSITMPTVASGYIIEADGNMMSYSADNYAKALNNAMQTAFKGKVTVSNAATDGSLKLHFDVQEGSSLIVNTDVGDALGIGTIATSYLNTNKTLGELMGDKLEGLTPNGKKDADGNDLYDFVINGVKVGSYSKNNTLAELMNDINKSDAGVKVSYSQTTKKFLFEATESGADSEIKLGGGLAEAMFGMSVSGEDKVSEVFKGLELGENDNQLLAFETPSGVVLSFDVDSNTTMDSILEKLGSAFKAEGYTVSYDDVTGKIVATDADGKTLNVKASKASYVDVEGEKWPELVVGEELEYKNDPKISYTKGQDAIFNVTINGETLQMSRSTNTIDIDGLSITLKDTFNSKVDENGNQVKGEDGKYQVDNKLDSVTFKSETDSDKLIGIIKDMVNDYNTMMSEIKSTFMTMPYQKDGAFANYEPLTDEDREGMSESAIERYEEKAKQGILFGDQTLSALYTKMNQAFSFSSTADVNALKDMGISVSYNINDGTQAITIDEEKLRSMLDSDPERVADLFTKTDGIMDRMKTQLDAYAKTTGEPKGILIQRAGSPLSSLSLLNNTWQSEINNYTKQIETWQTKLESQVERYTSQFTRLETLINQMNSQSSALASLMSGNY